MFYLYVILFTRFVQQTKVNSFKCFNVVEMYAFLVFDRYKILNSVKFLPKCIDTSTGKRSPENMTMFQFSFTGVDSFISKLLYTR